MVKRDPEKKKKIVGRKIYWRKYIVKRPMEINLSRKWEDMYIFQKGSPSTKYNDKK